MQVQAASQLLIDELAARHTHGFAHEISGMAPNTVAAAPPASLEETGAGLTVASLPPPAPSSPVRGATSSSPMPHPSHKYVCVCARARACCTYIYFTGLNTHRSRRSG